RSPPRAHRPTRDGRAGAGWTTVWGGEGRATGSGRWPEGPGWRATPGRTRRIAWWGGEARRPPLAFLDAGPKHPHPAGDGYPPPSAPQLLLQPRERGPVLRHRPGQGAPLVQEALHRRGEVMVAGRASMCDGRGLVERRTQRARVAQQGARDVAESTGCLLPRLRVLDRPAEEVP